MPRSPAVLLLALALSPGCATAASSTAAPPPQPSAPRLPPQISPHPAPVFLSVSLSPRTHAGACDLLVVDGKETDLGGLTSAARNLSRVSPQAHAVLKVDSSCPAADADRIKRAILEGGLASIDNLGTVAGPAASGNTNPFAVALYGQLRGQARGNLFFSPLSVAAALALVDSGAGGETAAQLDAALGKGLPHAQVHASIAALVKQYLASKGEATLEVANRLWARQALAFKPAYLAQVNAEFSAAVEPIDFDAPEPARKKINAWVSERTHGKIADLLQSGTVTPQTGLVLTNAVYFLGTWQHPFDPAETRPATFTLQGGVQEQVPTMHLVEKLRAGMQQEVQVVELPYGNAGALVLDLIVPNQADGLPALEAGLTPEYLDGLFSHLQRKRVTLALPRFSMRSQFELRPALEAMGLTALFAHTDLTPMLERGGVGISAVVHQAFVDVNEKGTEAAAATAVMGARSLERLPDLTVTANHPFLFVIRDTATGGVLFMGRVADPK
jgi:serpin B